MAVKRHLKNKNTLIKNKKRQMRKEILPLVKPHPNLIQNRSNKTKAKIGEMIWTTVRNKGNEKYIELWSIVELSKKFKISTRTLHKYLSGNIHRDFESWGRKKLVILREKDIVNARDLIGLYNRFKHLDWGEQLPIKYLMDFLWRIL